MMQAAFFTLVVDLFDSRVYPGVAPACTVAPYCTYTRVVSIEQTTLDTNGGTENESNTRLQVDVYAATYADAQAKAKAVKAQLKLWTLANVLLVEQDFREPDTGLHRVMLDVSVWHT